MSRTPRFFIEKKNEDDGWDDVNLYIKNKDGEYEPVWIDTGNADYELFDLIFEDFDGAYRSLPYNLGPTASEYFDKDDGDGLPPMRKAAKTTWYDYVELNLLAQTEKAMVTDYEAEPNENGAYPKYNALAALVDKINFIVAENQIYFPKPGEVRILCSII